MANNSLTNRQPKFSVAIQSDAYKNLINRTLGDPDRARRFVASISSAVAANTELQKCDAGTILSGALLGESLNLSPSPQLGQYYLIPYEDKKRGCTVAQFQLGYKGYIQLAIRSGQYRKLNVVEIKEGELKNYDPLTEEITVNLIEDEAARENAETIGYYAMFEYINGFRKALYWSVEKMMAHADRYSNAFSADNAIKIRNGQMPKNEMWKCSSPWYKDFDGMAIKTMLRQIISKWGIMSIDLQNAFVNDMAAIDTDGKLEYVDNLEPVKSPEMPDDNIADGSDVPVNKRSAAEEFFE